MGILRPSWVDIHEDGKCAVRDMSRFIAHGSADPSQTLSESKNLAELSSLGHFLKGSSAALGVAKVQASCERMQHYGQQRDEEAGTKLSDEEALNRIGTLLEQVKKEYGDAEKWLKNWYKEHGVEQDV